MIEKEKDFLRLYSEVVREAPEVNAFITSIAPDEDEIDMEETLLQKLFRWFKIW